MHIVKKFNYIYNKMRIVREMIDFKRGIDPKDAMDTGLQNTIETWLIHNNIKDFELSDDMKITAFSTIELSNKLHSSLPSYIQFDTAHNGFYFSHNELISLKGVPEKIKGAFVCSNNLLMDLEHGPMYVGGFYVVDNNKLISLKGLPDKINTLVINDNLLTSLEGCPTTINGDLFCYNNNLKNLDFLPERIKGSLYISYTEEFKNKYNINDFKNPVGHIFIDEIQTICNIDEKIKII